MRHSLRRPNQLGLFALLTGTLVFSLSSGPGGARVSSVSLSSVRTVSDCDKLQDRMELSKDDDQNASCSVIVATKDGKRIKTVFTARTGIQQRRAVGTKEASKTVALIIDATCETCKTGPERHVRPLDAIRDIRDWAVSQAQAEVEKAELAAEEEAAEEAAKAEADAKIDGCAVAADGRPQRKTPRDLMICRIGQMDGKDEVSDNAYFTKWIQPELQRLARSGDVADRQLAKSALLSIYERHANNPVIKESAVQIGNFSTYVTNFEHIANQIDHAPEKSEPRRMLLAQLGELRAQWTTTYQKRRELMQRAGMSDPNVLENAKVLEAALNANYAKYADEIKTTPNAGGTGQGRTLFGQPQVPGARGTSLPSPVGGRGLGQPTAPVGGGNPSFNQSVLRPR